MDDAGRKKGEEDWLTNVFGNRNAAQMAMTLAEQKARLGRGAQAADNAADSHTAAANVRNGDPNFGVAQFEAALSNLAATMGNLAMPAIVTSMQQLAAAAQSATAALKYIGDLNDKSKQFLKPLDALAHPRQSGSVYEGDMGASIADALHPGPGASGPHGVVGPQKSGPGGWSNMGSFAAPNVAVTANVNATLSGKAEAVFGAVTVQVEGLGGAIAGLIKAGAGSLAGSFQSAAQNSPSFHDSRMSPPTTDMGGIGHN
jgi:hypothetical protein